MKTLLFQSSDPISLLSLLSSLETACVSNSIQGGVAMWLVPYLIREPAEAAASHRLTAER